MNRVCFFENSGIEGFLINWAFTTKMTNAKEKMEKEIVEQELSVLIEITLRLEDELNNIIVQKV